MISVTEKRELLLSRILILPSYPRLRKVVGEVTGRRKVGSGAESRVVRTVRESGERFGLYCTVCFAVLRLGDVDGREK